MPKTKTTTTTDAPPAPAAPVALRYIGPRDAESPRYGVLEPGRVYQETDPGFASYLVTTHPEHWTLAG